MRCILFIKNQEENKLLLFLLRTNIAYLTDEDLHCESFIKLEEAEKELQNRDSDVIFWDVRGEKECRILEEIRLQDKEAYLVVVATNDVSPLTFLTPKIAPSSLLILPATNAEVRRVTLEFLELLSQRGLNKARDIFHIESRNYTKHVSYEKILYFEARNGRIYLHLRNEEVGFMTTLERLEKEIPDYFVRCHRSILVNLKHVVGANYTENMLELLDGTRLPLSRGCKKAFREKYDGTN